MVPLILQTIILIPTFAQILDEPPDNLPGACHRYNRLQRRERASEGRVCVGGGGGAPVHHCAFTKCYYLRNNDTPAVSRRHTLYDALVYDDAIYDAQYMMRNIYDAVYDDARRDHRVGVDGGKTSSWAAGGVTPSRPFKTQYAAWKLKSN